MSIFKNHGEQTKLAGSIYENLNGSLPEDISRQDLLELSQVQARQIASRTDDLQDYRDDLLAGNLLDFEE